MAKLLVLLVVAAPFIACESLPFGLGAEEEPIESPGGKLLELRGTRWLVRAYGDEAQWTTPLEGTLLSVEFASEQRLSGSAGCNRYSAGYSIEGERFTVGPVASTRMFCAEPEGVMLQETAFLAALERVASFEQQAERLELFDESGGTVVDLVSAVTGSFSYRIRRAIPPDTRLRVSLEEVLPPATTRLIAEHSFLASGKQLAFEFTVVFDPARIDPRRTYLLRADMHDRDRTLIMTTAAPVPVITNDHPSFGVEVTLDATEQGPG